MMSFWQNLAGREKVLVGIAGALFALVVGWFMILQPLMGYPGAQKRAYERAESNLEILRTGQAVLAGHTQTTKTTLSLTEAQFRITKSAADQGLSISRRQPNGEDGLSLWFESVESPRIYAWLESLTRDYNITLVRVNVNRNNDGTVRAQITFKMGG